MDQKDLEEFANIVSNPELLANFKRKVALQEFKDKYNVDRASPLHCPACSQSGYTGGSLYFNKDIPTKCVCRKCFLEWNIECLTTPVQDLIYKIKEASKSGEQFTSKGQDD